jgi:hypothetical protein
MSKEAMKLALEALEYIRNIETDVVSQIKYGNASQIIEEALEKPDFWEGYVPEPVKPAQQEFVSPGGGYVPAIPVQQRPIKTFHGGKAWPVQEPAQPVPDAFEQLMREADKPTQVPEGIAKYVDALVKGTHEITSVTIRPKRTWVGLTDDEVFDVWLNEMPAPDKVFYQKLCRSIEAKLKEKNT